MRTLGSEHEVLTPTRLLPGIETGSWRTRTLADCGRAADQPGVIAFPCGNQWIAVLMSLRWEANPLWRNVVDRFGLTTAKWYGMTGKIFVSVLAAQMVAFYLINRELLFPVQPCSPLEFLARMGSRARTLRERLLGLFTIFAFFFAGINLFYFYIAYLNWVDDPEGFAFLPSVPVSLLLIVSTLAALFAVLTYRAFRHSLAAKSD